LESKDIGIRKSEFLAKTQFFFEDISDSTDIEIALEKTEELKAYTAEFLGNQKQNHIIRME